MPKVPTFADYKRDGYLLRRWAAQPCSPQFAMNSALSLLEEARRDLLRGMPNRYDVRHGDHHRALVAVEEAIRWAKSKL